METFLPQFDEACIENETNGKDLYPGFNSTVLLHACYKSQRMVLTASHTFLAFDQGASNDGIGEMAISRLYFSTVWHRRINPPS